MRYIIVDEGGTHTWISPPALTKRRLPKPSFILLSVAAVICTTFLRFFSIADKDHLEKYGRLICGDRYIAMKHGPVPSGAYDLVKVVRGDRPCEPDNRIKEVLAMSGNTIIPKREPNLNLLSQSDIESLNIAIDKSSHLSFGDLQYLSHQDPAFQKADGESDTISVENLVKSLPDGELLWDHLTND